MRTDFNASSVAPWGARARGPAARCRACGSTLNRWVMAGFPEKRWDLDCCRGGASGAVLKGAGAIGRVDVVQPRGWSAQELREETSGLRASSDGGDWEPLPPAQLEATAPVAGLAEPVEARRSGTGARQDVEATGEVPRAKEPENDLAEEEPFPLLPSIPFARG